MIQLYNENNLGNFNPLSSDKTQIWFLRLSHCQDYLIKNLSILSTSEKNYIDKFVKPVDRKRSALPRIILHHVLSEYSDTSPEKIDIRKEKNGKPIAVNIQEAYISISHSGDYIAVAVSIAHRIGIDVEKIIPIPDYLQIASHFFHQDENNIIRNSMDMQLFYQYWTAKEAFVKAIGTGLSRDLNTFYVDLEHNMIIDLLNKNQHWSLLQWITEELYSVSFVYENEE